MANDNKSIFRQESLDSSTSPEVLNKYIKSATPKLWLLLLSFILILVGVIIWANLGFVEVKEDVIIAVNNGQYTAEITKESYEALKADSFIRVNDSNVDIDKNYIEKQDGQEPIYIVSGKCSNSNGNYIAQLIVERMHPMKFVTN